MRSLIWATLSSCSSSGRPGGSGPHDLFATLRTTCRQSYARRHRMRDAAPTKIPEAEKSTELTDEQLDDVAGGAPHVSEIVVTKHMDCASTGLFSPSATTV